ncbi:hypothetical protein EW026_g536 [Hermanssonia centrifuga]|uniref:Thaumatin-like protein n=1 Tax=Hermanssonia centrifuga TaxID=98765 RepID=A0A4S4KW63_9APHY|nr:hypothetical protein EW026_g536 [Hermanssonia centrifuga]
MRSTSFIVLLAAVAGVYAQCSSLGTGASDSATEFTLSAFNPATSVTSPLHLVSVVTIPHTSFHVLSTQAATINWLGFTMTSGIITAIPPNGETAAVASLGNINPDPSNISPPAGPWPTWSNTLAPPSELFCSVPNPSGGDAILALHDRTDLFFLCPSFFSSGVDPVAIVYNASSSVFPDAFSYDGASCQPVTLLLVPSS